MKLHLNDETAVYPELLGVEVYIEPENFDKFLEIMKRSEKGKHIGVYVI